MVLLIEPFFRTPRFGGLYSPPPPLFWGGLLTPPPKLKTRLPQPLPASSARACKIGRDPRKGRVERPHCILATSFLNSLQPTQPLQHTLQPSHPAINPSIHPSIHPSIKMAQTTHGWAHPHGDRGDHLPRTPARPRRPKRAKGPASAPANRARCPNRDSGQEGFDSGGKGGHIALWLEPKKRLQCLC